MTATASMPVDAATAREITGSVYLSRKETAVYMGISEKWLATNWRTGPRFQKIGNKTTYRLSDIENFIKQQVAVPR